VPVQATIGETTWATSIFSDAKTASYLLPVRTAVRGEAGIDEGDSISVTIETNA